MGLCGSKPEESMQNTTSVMPKKTGQPSLTKERLKAMEDDDLSYLEESGYSAVSLYCGTKTARRLHKEYSDEEFSDSESDDDSFTYSDLSENESLLSRQSSTDTLISSRPGSAESQSSRTDA